MGKYLIQALPFASNRYINVNNNNQILYHERWQFIMEWYKPLCGCVHKDKLRVSLERREECTILQIPD